MTAQMAAGAVVVRGQEPLWFLGTLQRLKLDGAETGGRFALWEGVPPHGAAPPLHSHPQDETFYVVAACGQRGGVGMVAFAPGGTPHAFRVESDTAKMLFLSTPVGVEEYIKALSEPARWPWLQPPADGPRVPAERIHAVELELGMTRHGPPPPPN